MKSRIVIIFISFLFLWLLLIVKAVYVQVIPNEKLIQLKEKSFNRIVSLKSRRGAIFDRDQRELAISIPSYSLYADPKIIKNPRDVSRKLGKHFRKSSRHYYGKLKNKEKRFVWLERRSNKSHRDIIQGWGIRGLALIEEPTRVYPNDQLFAHLLGFVGSEERGLEGLELVYDDILIGENRRLKFHKDARGRPLLANGQVFLDHPDGSDLYLTVDSGLQFKLEKELQGVMDEFEAESALGVILDAETSEILAMANLPTFNVNKPLRYSEAVRRNKVVTDSFEPGSTMKTFSIAGAISYGLVQPNTKIDCGKGGFRIGGRLIREANVTHGFGDLNISEVLALSSNVCSAKLALKLGDKRLRETLKKFGFGEKMGIDLPGESSGILKKTPWRDHLLSNVSFGHGVTATPLQIAAAYAAIANGGVLKRPYIVKSIVSHDSGLPSSEVREEFGPQVVRRVLSPEVASTMRLMLAGVTSPSGTGFLARVPGFPVAGKTGTAQKVKKDRRGYEKGKYISSFVGFIPVNKPKYVIYIAVDSPLKKYYGSVVAAPVFSRIANYAVLKEGLPPVLLDQGDIIHVGKNKNTDREDKGRSEKGREVSLQKLALESLAKFQVVRTVDGEEVGKVPSLLGLPLRGAYRQVAGMGIKLKVRGSWGRGSDES